MSIRLGTSTMRRTLPRFLRTRKLDWTTDGIDFLRLSLCARGGHATRTAQAALAIERACKHEATKQSRRSPKERLLSSTRARGSELSTRARVTGSPASLQGGGGDGGRDSAQLGGASGAPGSIGSRRPDRAKPTKHRLRQRPPPLPPSFGGTRFPA